MKFIGKILLSFLLPIILFTITNGQEADTLKKKRLPKSFLRQDRNWTIEIPIWIPGFAGEFAYGDVSLEGEDGENPGEPSHPIEPPDPGEPPGGGNIISRLFTSTSYLKFFFMNQIAFEKNKLLLQADMFAGTVGNSVNFKYNDKTVVEGYFRSILLRFLAGYKFYQWDSRNKKNKYELFGYGGIRVHFVKVHSDLFGSVINLDIAPNWVEPIIGVQNQFTLKNWMFVLQADYGGLFIKNKRSFMINGLVYYKLGNLTSIKFGWADWDIKQTRTFRGEDLSLKVHLSGPSVGVNFHF